MYSFQSNILHYFDFFMKLCYILYTKYAFHEVMLHITHKIGFNIHFFLVQWKLWSTLRAVQQWRQEESVS